MKSWRVAWLCVVSFGISSAGLSTALAEEGLFGTPKGTEGTRIFKATEHPSYSGKFRLRGGAPFLIGSMKDQSPWDHLDYAGKYLTPVQGTIEIEVNEVLNSGRVIAQFSEESDHYRIVFDRFAGKQPFHDGGIATRVYEHGDSNNGDPLYPKTWLYLAGWGTATVFKNDEVLYQDYDAHFMVMERSRHPDTHQVQYPVKRMLPGGETDPAGMEIDLWVRSKEQNPKNYPPYETFLHLCWEEVTWR
ncbi:MAG: hypothetical protein A4C66_09385 [Nitrospira sp. HN-bin3]|uniref:hypothetical protein n=1 Tax=Nitrospira cf. moscoviensis SBR1015 TaxID=96242 RepID=UPI000A09800C|nr:hypothetical protein [Nitrospira cf. moscoviensis SBR1015]OQW42481.1 MAG: hypothetical protein A4C66_09385 [Nitrospira sp. HN-bin3]